VGCDPTHHYSAPTQGGHCHGGQLPPHMPPTAAGRGRRATELLPGWTESCVGKTATVTLYLPYKCLTVRRRGPPGLILRGKHTAKLLEAAPHRVDVGQSLVLNLTVWIVFCMRERRKRRKGKGEEEGRGGNVVTIN